MQKNLFTTFSEELQKNKLYIVSKDILKIEVMTAAMNLDPKLIKLILAE